MIWSLGVQGPGRCCSLIFESLSGVFSEAEAIIKGLHHFVIKNLDSSESEVATLSWLDLDGKKQEGPQG